MQPNTNPVAQLWQQGRAQHTAATPDLDRIQSEVLTASRQSARDQFQTVLVLTATLIALSVYFLTYLTRQVEFSTLGKGLMLGTLVLRIALEVYSIGLARRVRPTDATQEFIQRSLALIRYREAAIRWFAVVGGLAYTIGYALLVYVYRPYLSPLALTALIVSYLAAVAVVGYFIFLGYKEERVKLEAYEALVKELSQYG